jgi:hypothetical protein
MSTDPRRALDPYPAASENSYDTGRLSGPFDDAAQVDEARRTGTTGIYQALFSDLNPDEQHWVRDVMARHETAE